MLVSLFGVMELLLMQLLGVALRLQPARLGRRVTLGGLVALQVDLLLLLRSLQLALLGFLLQILGTLKLTEFMFGL